MEEENKLIVLCVCPLVPPLIFRYIQSMTICRWCAGEFLVTERDRDFLRRMSPVINGKTFLIPEPTLCPSCRTKRRFAFRNERNLSKTKSALSGKEIISNIHPDDLWKVYEQEEWFGDSWNGTDFGRPYNFSRSFTEQYLELQREVPVFNLNMLNNENCSYCNQVASAKNCYLIYGSINCEDCYYGSPYYSKNCVDSLLVRNSELCYECITSEQCFECFFCQDLENCQNLVFCYDCKGCKHCIGCAGLRNKEYFVFNKPQTKEEYEKIRNSLDLSNLKHTTELRTKFEAVKMATPHRFAVFLNSENCTGDYISHSRNTFDSYDVQRCEDVSYSAQVIDLKDCSDCNFTEENELCYEYTAHYINQNVSFSISTHNSHDIRYSSYCMFSNNLFGCVGMKHGEYAIMNMKYSKRDYEDLLPRIIEHMKSDGTWGEFFHPSLSYFCYNESVANEYFPMEKKEAGKAGWKWRESNPKEYAQPTCVPAGDIAKVGDSIVNEILACGQCRKNYRIIKQELDFYRKFGLPIPLLCPDCRHNARLAMRNPRRLMARSCSLCGTEMKTTYGVDRTEPVYCEKCYLKDKY